jgi:argininosuccinate lyase
MWSGRFQAGTSKLVEEFTQSVGFDKRFYKQDIAGSKAHARMLGRQGVLAAEEVKAIVQGLDAVLAEINSGAFVWREELEDVHMNIEQRLTDLIGEVGKKLHTGRSRNDQVALDFRLYVVERIGVWRAALKTLVAVLLEKADAHRETLLPGCTHLQPAQPVSLAHHLLAYAWMFKRDWERLGDSRKRAAVSPLGAAALAGTTYPLDPALVAQELGLEGALQNSMDAVSDRDFVVETLAAGSLIMAHLSRFCEELILWANPAFGFVKLPDGYATGSSIMPQKKNPDVAELIRGKTGRVYGALTALLTTLKGLPLAYNRDLQEDKEPFFDADKTVSGSLTLMAGMLDALDFNVEAMRAALTAGFLNATELADYLATKGVPFREAHHITGRAVAFAEASAKPLEALTLDELRAFSPLIEQDVFQALDYKTAVARRETQGGTGPRSVERQLSALRVWLENE